ncbi:MAG: hypothetical protein HY000_22230 [Planctomycetes bacterium]|nr:hypothetical protein [Planctomycetota bacterium]
MIPTELWLSSVLVSVAASAVETGTIAGNFEKIAAGWTVTSVVAVDRATLKRFDGRVEAGKFRIDGLPLGVPLDVIIDFKASQPASPQTPQSTSPASYRLEGVNMKVPRSDYEEEQPLSPEDIKTIKGKVLGLNQFEDVVQILAIHGNIQHAAILVNKLRTKPFYESKPGEVIWRPELWHFERPEDTWVKVQDELFVILYRERIGKSDYDKKSVTFDPVLGGIQLTAESSKVDLGAIGQPEAKPGVYYRGVGTRLDRTEKPGKRPDAADLCYSRIRPHGVGTRNRCIESRARSRFVTDTV